MARRDVDLVIRARDEAVKVLDQITGALEDFRDASSGVDSSAEKTQSSLGGLGAAIGDLRKQIGGLDVGDKLASEMAKAAAEMDKMRSKADATGREAVELQKKLSQAGDRADRFAQKLAGGTAALTRQRGVLKTAKADHRDLATAYALSEKAQARLTARQGRLPEQIERQSAALRKAQARYAELADKIEQTEEPSRSLREQFEASERSVTQHAAKLTRLEDQYQAISGQLRAAGSAMVIFGEKTKQAESNVSKQSAILKKIETNLTGLKGSARAAASEQSRLAGAFDKINDAIARQDARMEKAEVGYAELAGAAGKADQALEKLTATAKGGLERSLVSQRRATLEAKREYLGLSDAATRLATDLRQTSNPSRALVEEFERTKVAARQAKSEYLAQRVALEQMGRAYRATGADLSSISGTQQRFIQILRETSGALNKAEKAAQDASTDLDRLYGAATRAGKGLKSSAQGARDHAAATQRGAAATSRMAAAYRQFYGDTRRSLSLLQRIRGEVLSLIAAYGGLYAVIEVLRGTTQAYQTLEAAQARLKVAFDGDADRAAVELNFLRRQADRLGISFGTLATEYSKFAIATKNTNLEGDNTRRIFVAVAEAARVNRSSTQEMAGVFVALTQIVSKGAVQMEELRQQLGDRLPGALKIMADGLGVSTGELIKMMEQGQVSSDALVPFAEELERRFGQGLPEALQSTSTAIGRLANAAFEALLRFGEAGFLESFTAFANTLTETLQSADFESFSNRMSQAFGLLLNFLGFAVENFNVLIAVVVAFLALRITPVVLAAAASINGMAGSALGAGVAFKTLQARAAAMGVTVTRVGFMVRNLRRSLLLLMGTTGVGLLVAAIGAGVALWATSADQATSSMDTHRRIVDSVKNSYEQAGDGVEGWAEKINTVTFTQATASLQSLQSQFEAARRDAIVYPLAIENMYRRTVGGIEETRVELRDLTRAFRAGLVPVDEYKRRLEELAQSDTTLDRELVLALQNAADETRDLEKATAEANAVVVLLSRNSSEAAREAALVTLGMKDAMEEAGDGAEEAATKADKFNAAMAKMGELVPAVKAQLEFEDAITQLEAMYQAALETASGIDEMAAATMRFEQAKAALEANFAASISGLAGASTGADAAAALIRSQEGFRSTPYYDVNAYRVGYGSDTVTLADGSVKKVTEGMRVSVEDANRDLLRRIATEFLPTARNAVGAGQFDRLSPQQQAVLTSIAYNYGELPESVASAVREGLSDADIAAAIRGLGAGGHAGTDVGDALIKRRNREAAIFSSGVGESEAIRRQEEASRRLAEEEERRAKAAAEAAEATQSRLADSQFEIDQQELKNQGLERQAAVEAAIREAKAENAAITEEELALIAEQAGRLFDLQQAEKNRTTAKERAAEAEEEVNNLLAQRQALQRQQEIASEQGEYERANELRGELVAINEELIKAIDNAIAMWEAVGGSGASAAIAKLQTARIEAQNLSTQGQQNHLQWNRVGDLFGNGLANAFDTFAQSVAQGESIGKSARKAFLQFAADFLRQIAMMIIKQAIFNALRAAFGGTGFGALIGLGHTGGLVGSARVGSGNRTRKVDPGIFAAAQRFHNGGLIGLAPNEVPIIAKKGEEMLTEDDPRHMLNGGGKQDTGSAESDVRVFNYFDPEDMMEQALASPAGAKVLINAVRRNNDLFRAALGVRS